MGLGKEERSSYIKLKRAMRPTSVSACMEETFITLYQVCFSHARPHLCQSWWYFLFLMLNGSFHGNTGAKRGWGGARGMLVCQQALGDRAGPSGLGRT